MGYLRPASLLVSLDANRRHYPHAFGKEVSRELVLDGLARGSTDSLKSQFEDYSALCHEWLRKNELVASALARIAAIGLRSKFYISEGDWGEWVSALCVWADDESMARLEGLAADDAGIIEAKERAHAAERFRIYMARNWSKDYLANREIYPDVGGSPYCDPSQWSKNT